MKNYLYLLAILISFLGCSIVVAQESQDEAINDIKKHREKQRQSFSDPEKSPLEPSDLKKFQDLEYYPINLKYRVTATFKKYDAMKLFYMKTTTDRLPKYSRYAELTFNIDGKTFKLQAYQNQTLMEEEDYENYLFIPYTDLSCGEQSYGGGRYLDIKIPEGKEVILDFNKSYNPYCCYNSKYSCPIPPRENDLNVEILAGVKDFKGGKH